MAGNAPSNAELAQQIAALTAVVTNLANAIATQAPAPAVAPPAAAVSFATSPGVAAIEELIDYTTKHGASLYEQGTKALGTPFNMKSNQVVIFEKQLQDRASMMGWDQGAQNILQFTNKDGRQISLIAEYGQIDAETLKTVYGKFMTGVNSDKQAAQSNKQMCCCLYSRLTKEAKVTA
jgi:flagellar hook-associated protein FlgK